MAAEFTQTMGLIFDFNGIYEFLVSNVQNYLTAINVFIVPVIILNEMPLFFCDS
jgi:hypothetical protein